VDLLEKYNLDEEDHGLERFITATRRQNYLIPPAAHRSFRWPSWCEPTPGVAHLVLEAK